MFRNKQTLPYILLFVLFFWGGRLETFGELSVHMHLLFYSTGLSSSVFDWPSSWPILFQWVIWEQVYFRWSTTDFELMEHFFSPLGLKISSCCFWDGEAVVFFICNLYVFRLCVVYLSHHYTSTKMIFSRWFPCFYSPLCPNILIWQMVLVIHSKSTTFNTGFGFGEKIFVWALWSPVPVNTLEELIEG